MYNLTYLKFLKVLELFHDNIIYHYLYFYVKFNHV